MREIKFRIWHKPTNKYVTMSQEDWSYGKGLVKYKDSGDFLAISHDGFLCHEGYGNGAANVEDSENYVVQQYTGLKDKNGVEIYEGDIIIFDNSDIGGQRYKGIVEWNTDPTLDGLCFGLFIPPKFDGKSGWFSCDFLGDLEVIGNIFEGVDK
jgi:uncharacterized phage protein (TIGR01671 family)